MLWVEVVEFDLFVAVEVPIDLLIHGCSIEVAVVEVLGQPGPSAALPATSVSAESAVARCPVGCDWTEVAGSSACRAGHVCGIHLVGRRSPEATAPCGIPSISSSGASPTQGKAREGFRGTFGAPTFEESGRTAIAGDAKLLLQVADPKCDIQYWGGCSVRRVGASHDQHIASRFQRCEIIRIAKAALRVVVLEDVAARRLGFFGRRDGSIELETEVALDEERSGQSEWVDVGDREPGGQMLVGDDSQG